MELRDRDGLTEQEFLERYRPGDYARPSVACDMVIFTVMDADAGNYRRLPEKQLRVLLIERGGHPFLGCWALPGGFVRPAETVGQAAARELREETGVENVYLEQLGVFSDPGRDPRTWVMSCAHMALIDSGQVRLQAGDDAQNAAWFLVSCAPQPEKPARFTLKLTGSDTTLCAVVERRMTTSAGAEEYTIIENDGLAFDHAKIIVCALERLRAQTVSGGAAFHLLPERFTLTELQQVHEVLLGRPLLKAAFRRKIAPLVQETDQMTQNAGHRPSRLYQRKQEDRT